MRGKKKKQPGERSGDRGGVMRRLKGSVAEGEVVPGNQEAGARDLAGKVRLDTNHLRLTSPKLPLTLII